MKSVKHAKITNDQIDAIVNAFINDNSITETSHDLTLNRHTVARFYSMCRKKIIQYECNRLKRCSQNGNLLIENIDTNFTLNRQNTVSPNNKIILFILVCNKRVFVNVLLDNFDEVNRPRVKNKISHHEYGWRRLSIDISKRYEVYGLISKSNGKQSRLVYNFLSHHRRFIKKHYGIPRNQLFGYLKESQYRFNGESFLYGIRKFLKFTHNN